MGSNWIKSKQGNLQSSEKDCCDSLDYRGLDAHFTNGGESLPIVQTHTNSLVPPSHPIYNPFSSHKTVSTNSLLNHNNFGRQFCSNSIPKLTQEIESMLYFSVC